MEEKKFEPKIAAFVCNWCTYTGADLAGHFAIKIHNQCKNDSRAVHRQNRSGFYHQSFFEKGADGVLISGCHPNDCHYNTGNFHARRRWILFRQLLDFIGIDSSRLHFSWVSASEGKSLLMLLLK